MTSSGKTTVAALILAVTEILSVAAEDSSRLADSVVLFGDELPPLVLNSDRGWIAVGTVDWDDADLDSAAPGETTRRWRLRTSYGHDRASGAATVQIRIRNSEGAPTFTHPWTDSADARAESYSNWYEDAGSSLGDGGQGLVEARLVAPPRHPLSGKLYSVVLEAWDSVDPDEVRNSAPAGPEVQLAYVRPLPTARTASGPAGRADAGAEDPSLGPQAALDFALSFVESCLTGDLPDYYRAQADPVRSLDDGKAMARYRLNPPTGIPGIGSLEDYKRRFDYRIYPAETYAELFPEWFEADRPWTPGENAWLFMGHRDRLAGAFPEGAGYLVFLIEPDEAGEWHVVARPGGAR